MFSSIHFRLKRASVPTLPQESCDDKWESLEPRPSDKCSTKLPPVMQIEKRSTPVSQNWNFSVGPPIDVPLHGQLPTKRALLQRYRYLRSTELQRPTADIAYQLADETLILWRTSPNIPLLSKPQVQRVIKILLDKHLSMTPYERTASSYQNDLEELLDVCKVSADELKRIAPEDYLFYVGMKKVPQLGYISHTKDKVFNEKQAASKTRKAQSEAYLSIPTLHDSQSTCSVSSPVILGKRAPQPRKIVTKQFEGRANEKWFNDPSSESELDSDDEPPDWEEMPLRMKKEANKKPTEVTATLPAKEISKLLAKVSTINKTSSRKEYKSTCAILVTGGVNLHDVTLSNSTIHRHRKQHIKESAKISRESFKCPEFLIIHYDSKIIQRQSGVTEDRLAILFSSPGNFNKHFVASPVIPDGGAAACTAALTKALDDCEAKTSCIGQVFDTPSVNTGWRNGVCQRLQRFLNRPILQLACRHHTGEVHMWHAYFSCRGDQYTKGSENSLYKRLIRDWPRISGIIQQQPERRLKWTPPADPNDWRNIQRAKVLVWAGQTMLNGSFRRGDHRVLLEKTVRYLVGDVIRKKEGGKIKHVSDTKEPKPISGNQSRFMGIGIDEVTIAMMMGPGLFQMDDECKAQTESLAEMDALVWNPHFLQSHNAAAAPRL